MSRLGLARRLDLLAVRVTPPGQSKKWQIFIVSGDGSQVAGPIIEVDGDLRKPIGLGRAPIAE